MQTAPDPDLREYQAHMALSAIGNRAQKQLLPTTKNFQKTKFQNEKSIPLFDLDENEGEFISGNVLQYWADDGELAFAVQDSFDQKQRANPSHADTSSKDAHTTHYSTHSAPSRQLSEEEDLFLTPTPLETALSIAGAGPSRPNHYPLPSTFGRPVLLSPSPQPPSTALLSHREQGDTTATQDISKPSTSKRTLASEQASDVDTLSDSGMDLEEVTGFSSPVVGEVGIHHAQIVTDSDSDMEEILPERDFDISRPPDELNTMPSPITHNPSSLLITGDPPTAGPSRVQRVDEGDRNSFSRSPSPFRQPSDISSPRSPSPMHDSWDAAQEMDPHTEEGEYAHFISQVKGKNIDDVRREIDDEIKSLNQQKKAALRDSDDITQQMISQIMVSWSHSSSFACILLNV